MRFAALRAVQPLALPLAPILAVQGRGVRARTPRLPEAAGPDHGTAAGDGPVIRLAVLGDSTAAGVGAERHDQALPGRLAVALAAATGRPVAWRTAGRSGATARQVREEFAPGLAGAPADVVVILVGINDLLKLRPLRRWEQDVTELIAAVRAAGGPVPVLVAGMPHVHRFPSLPQPLRGVMGLRALAMDHAVRRVAARLPQVVHLRAAAPDLSDERLYAADRFHPSTEGYRLWAGQLAPAVAALVA
ncbi:Lysophospholipase L1 [Thermomonospora echinospora]|uniref:Lysophospholipase L1 n=1 Tax=Thermomonospora echinospora TaxID=1992 RepID=A0A1H6DPV4_9ACTN|nr:SGNH/GDSL hydrolase family protein [Thermomonospora echinospora]SEG87298.1 Lysophospholipase L1 [Thermomonospora echinospora]